MTFSQSNTTSSTPMCAASEVSTDCSAAAVAVDHTLSATRSCLLHPESPQAHSIVDDANLGKGERNSLALMLPSLGEVLNQVVMLGDAATSSMSQGQLTRFHAVRVPGISVQGYLKRLAKHFNCSNACFIISLIYIDKLIKARGGSFRINSFSIHRVLLTSLLVATKFYDDSYYSNAYYAKVGGIRLVELNALELRFLQLMRWSLVVDPEEYQEYKLRIMRVRLLDRNLCESLKPHTSSMGSPNRRSSIASTVDPEMASCGSTASSLSGSPCREGSKATVLANDRGICCPTIYTKDSGTGPFYPPQMGCHALRDEPLKLSRQSPRDFLPLLNYPEHSLCARVHM